MTNAGLKYDTPLSELKDDLLGRKRFAEMLAKSIAGMDASEGFVFGLYGEWGAGKSTVINFLEHYIEEQNKNAGPKDGKTVVFRFNPWLFSGTENLVGSFLDQLSRRLAMPDTSKKLRGIVKGLGFLEHSLNVAGMVPVYGELAKLLSATVKQTKDAAAGIEGDTRQDIHHIKEEITKKLRDQKDTILVVIDDVDRLFSDEIRQLLRLVKSVCDFPKVIYLLACDATRVAKALADNSERSDDGYAFLEKIVQCSFTLPNADRASLNQMFFIEVEGLMFPLKYSEVHFDTTEWGNIFHDGIEAFLKTPRNVKTLLNAIAAAYPAVKDEVNVADFIGMQVLRVFVPEMYRVIENNKDFFSGAAGDRGERETVKAFHVRLKEKMPEEKREVVDALLERLFPRYQASGSNIIYGGGSLQDWRRRCKVCSPECFDSYFALSIPADGFSRQEMLDLINLAKSDLTALKNELLLMNTQALPSGITRYKSFLTELEYYTEKDVPLDTIKPFLQAVFDISDQVPSDIDTIGFMGLDVGMQACRIIYQLLNRYKSQDERFAILKEVYSSSASLTLMVRDLMMHVPDENGKRAEEDMQISFAHAEELKKPVLKRIRELKSTLHTMPSFGNLLYRWREWGKPNEANQYIAKLIKTDDGLIALLKGLLSVSSSYGMSDRVAKTRDRVNHRDVKELLGIDDLKKLVERAESILKKEVPNSRGERALRAFIDEYRNPDKYRY